MKKTIVKAAAGIIFLCMAVALHAFPTSITKTANPVNVSAMGNVTFTIAYQNVSAGQVLNYRIWDTVPSFMMSTWNITDGGTLTGNVVYWDLGTLNSGDSGDVSFTCTLNMLSCLGGVAKTNDAVDSEGAFSSAGFNVPSCTATPTYSITTVPGSGTPTFTRTVTPTVTTTFTMIMPLSQTPTYTATPTFTATVGFGCWVDADGNGQESMIAVMNSGNSGYCKVALDNTGRPHIAWGDDTSGVSSIYYLKWNGTAWVDADGTGQESALIIQGSNPSLALNPSGYPMIAYGYTGIHFIKWNGTAWVDADGAGQESVQVYSSGSNILPVVRCDTLGRPHMAWTHDDGGAAKVYYLMWNGSAWVDVDGSGQAQADVYPGQTFSCTEPRLRIGAGNRPFVSFTFSNEIYLLQSTGTAWVDADGTGQESANVSNMSGDDNYSSLDLDSLSRPHLAWYHMDGSMHYIKFNGASWVDADGTGLESTAVNVAGTKIFAHLEIDALNLPHIVYKDDLGENYIKYNGTAWTDLDGTGTESRLITAYSGDYSGVSFGLDMADVPHVAIGFPAPMNNDIMHMKASSNCLFLLSRTPTMTITRTAAATGTATITMTMAIASATQYQTATRTITATNTITITAFSPTFTPTRTMSVTLTPYQTPTSMPTCYQVIDNCDDGDGYSFYGGSWFAYDDSDVGGTSYVMPRPLAAFNMQSPGQGATAYAARITGYVTTAWPYGYVGMGVYQSVSKVSSDVNIHKGIRFWAKGDGGVYKAYAMSDYGGYTLGEADNMYGNTFTAGASWTLIELPFSAMTQEIGWGSNVALTDALANFIGVRWQTTGGPHASIELWVDYVELYECVWGTATPVYTATRTPTMTMTLPAGSNTFTRTRTVTSTPTMTFTLTFTPSATPDVFSGDDTVIIGGPGNDKAGGSCKDGSGNIYVSVIQWDDGCTCYVLYIYKFLPDGSPDTSFGTNGRFRCPGPVVNYKWNDKVEIKCDASGRLVIAAYADACGGTCSDVIVYRCNSNGTTDLSFNGTGYRVCHNIAWTGQSFGYCLDFDSMGRIVVCGKAWNGTGYDMILCRLNTDGSIDTSFGTGGCVKHASASGDACGLKVVCSGGKIFVTGYVDEYVASCSCVCRVMYIWKYNEDGTPDTSFGTGGSCKYVNTALNHRNCVPMSITITLTGKIVVTGSVDDNSGCTVTCRSLAVWVYNADGTPDTSFGTGGCVFMKPTVSGAWGECVYVEADGKIIICGTTHNGTNTDICVIKLNQDGTPDTTFNGTGWRIYDSGGDDEGQSILSLTICRKIASGFTYNGANQYDVILWNIEDLCPVYSPTPTATVTRTPAAVSLSKSVSAVYANYGDTVTYTISYANASGSDIGSYSVFDDFSMIISTGRAEVVSTSPAATTVNAGVYRWDIGTLAASGSGTIDLVARVTGTNTTMPSICNRATDSLGGYTSFACLWQFTLTATLTPYATATYTATRTMTVTATRTPFITYTATPTYTMTATNTFTQYITPTSSVTPTVTSTQPCPVGTPQFTVHLVYNPEHEQQDHVVMEITSAVPLIAPPMLEIRAHGNTANKPVYNVTATAVPLDATGTLFRYLYPKLTGWGDIDSVKVTGTDICGQIGTSSGAYTKETISKKDLIVFKNLINPEIGERTRIVFMGYGASRAQVRVFNKNGVLVKVLFDGQIAANSQNEVIWDGTNSAGEKVVSGIYHIVAETDYYTAREKVALVH